MSRSVLIFVNATMVASLIGCGEIPQGEVTSPAPVATVQQISFTGVADPLTGRFRLFTGPQAAIGVITEDQDGNAATVTPGTAQIYGPSVAFASGGVAYPAVCNPTSPMVMSASVQVFSGFTEQLRNVYARVTYLTPGRTFCSKDAIIAVGGSASLSPNVGLYRYLPLDRGPAPASSISRSVQWAVNLPDNGAFSFNGSLWAEVIPQLPTLILPADNATFKSGNTTAEAAFSWKDDLAADGLNPEGYLVARPTRVGAELTIKQCGPTTSPYDPSTCTVTFSPATVVTGGQATALPPVGFWYQWTLRAAFRLPGAAVGATTIGTQVSTRYFQAVKG
jgi:hypothetical protein